MYLNVLISIKNPHFIVSFLQETPATLSTFTSSYQLKHLIAYYVDNTHTHTHKGIVQYKRRRKLNLLILIDQ